MKKIMIILAITAAFASCKKETLRQQTCGTVFDWNRGANGRNMLSVQVGDNTAQIPVTLDSTACANLIGQTYCYQQ